MAISVALGSDIFNASTPGFPYTFDDETVTILKNVIIASDTSDGVQSFRMNNVLHNGGDIFSHTGFGVDFAGTGNDRITNFLGGLIAGNLGVEMDSTGNNILNNYGTAVATSTYGVEFGSATGGMLLNNHGLVLSSFDAVLLESNNVGGQVNNFNLINGPDKGIWLLTEHNLSTVINNFVGGTIESLNNAIDATLGGFVLHNFGKIIGNIVEEDSGGAGAAIFNHGKIRGSVELKTGNDVFIGTGGTSGDIFTGTGNNRVVGGNGKVSIHLGTGFNTVTGGPGHNQLIFDSPLVGQFATIKHFSHGHDLLVLKAGDFMGLPVGLLDVNHFHVGAPVNGNPQIDYNKSTGALVFDPDGTGGAPPIEFAVIANHAHVLVHPHDILVVA